MPNIIDSTGLQTATLTELITNATAALKLIYGNDINLASDSPDGQLMMLAIQAVIDLEDIVTQVYTMFDPDNAIGVILDQRVAINGIQREQGTYTVTDVLITTTTNLNLYGLDQTTQPVFTVADQAGNQWQLLVTQNIAAAGTYAMAFQAAIPGAVLTTPNTITTPISIVLGVTTITNPTTYTTLGINEESDAVLKIRRQQAVQLSSTGFYNGLKAALENVNGVTSAFVNENDSDTIDSTGTPGHSIWVIIAGTVDPALIAQAIYSKRGTGVGMVGAQSYDITQADGTLFTVRWDIVVTENLYIRLIATSIDGINAPKIAQILTGLPLNFIPAVNGSVNVNQLATQVQAIDPNTLVSDAGFSTSALGPFTAIPLSPSARNHQFVILQTNILITPIVLLPATVNVPRGSTQTFTANGGGQSGFVYSITVNASGATINASTGVYTAGATIGIDTVQALDLLGNLATSTVTVV